eukprot:scaffold1159_cov215-Pinguiococcus_pyrenoidosus.AAC.21
MLLTSHFSRRHFLALALLWGSVLPALFVRPVAENCLQESLRTLQLLILLHEESVEPTLRIRTDKPWLFGGQRPRSPGFPSSAPREFLFFQILFFFLSHVVFIDRQLVCVCPLLHIAGSRAGQRKFAIALKGAVHRGQLGFPLRNRRVLFINLRSRCPPAPLFLPRDA